MKRCGADAPRGPRGERKREDKKEGDTKKD